jgi:hypothetical protein
MPTSPIELVLNKLPSAQRRGDGWVAKCPGHKDRMPSLKVDVAEDGRVLLHCHAGCEPSRVVEGMGLRLRDLMPEDAPTFDPVRAGHVGGRPALRVVQGAVASSSAEPSGRRPTGNPQDWPVTKVYPYVDADGVLLFEVLRKEAPDGSGKVFTQRQPDGGWGLKGVTDRPLYRLPAVLTAVQDGQPVLLVEGEKDVETAEALGWVATTNVGGASGWKPEHAEALRGAEVVLLPDNDAPGRKWAQTVAESLSGLAKRIRIVALPRVAEKGDLTDWVEMGGTSEQLAGLMNRAPAWVQGDPIPEQERPSRFRVYRADELAALPPVSWMVEDLLPTDALAALVGPSGKGKTFLTIDLACAVATGTRWLNQRVGLSGPVLYIAAEGTAGLRQRVAAWVTEHHAPSDLPVYFICETVNFMERSDVEHVLRATLALPAPPRLVIVDTLHRAMPGGDENSAKDVGVVITHADVLRREAGSTVLIVHHTKKDADIERGSTAMRAACDTLLLLRDEETVRTLAVDKQKDAAQAEPIPLRFYEAHGSLLVQPATVTVAAMERAADPMRLTNSERLALSALLDAGGQDGLTVTEWKDASQLATRTMHYVKSALERGGLIARNGRRGAPYTITPEGRNALQWALRKCSASATGMANVQENGDETFAHSRTNFLEGDTPLKGGVPPLSRGSASARSVAHGHRRGRPTDAPSGRDRAAGVDAPPERVTEWREFEQWEIPA